MRFAGIVCDDDSMKETVQSVKEYGVIMPVIVRPSDEGGYENIIGPIQQILAILYL